MLKSHFEDDPSATRPKSHSRQVEADEVELIARIVGGDALAFETLYRCYFLRLTRFLDRMTSSVHLIEEIVNDTMLVVWKKADTFDRSCKVSTWIFSIAYRRALKTIKRSDVPVDMDFEYIAAESGTEPEHEASRQQFQKSVGHALGSLPMEQRTVVNLTYFHGMGYQEIAETMNCPVNTVKTRMFHARKRLKTLLMRWMEAE